MKTADGIRSQRAAGSLTVALTIIYKLISHAPVILRIVSFKQKELLKRKRTSSCPQKTIYFAVRGFFTNPLLWGLAVKVMTS